MAGDQSLLKRINRLALVRLVRSEPGLSRVDLAKRTGLTKATVGILVQELIDEGWLCQRETSASQGVGRRPVPLALDPDRLGLLGAEVAVDALHVVATNLQGEILSSRMIALRHGAVGPSMRRLAGLIAEAHAALLAHGRRPLGLGVGVPGLVDGRGLLRFAPNIGWHDEPLAELLVPELERAGCRGLRPSLLNDANACALSEYVFGGDHHTAPLVFITMGIGLGAGVVLRDRLYVGHDGLAGEVGHTTLHRGGPPCACGRRGCAEVYISQKAVSRRALGRSSPVLALEELVARIARRDEAALAAASEAGEHLGVLMQNLSNILDPAVIVLGGPLCQLGDPLVQTAIRTLRENAGRHDVHRLAVRLSRFGQSACAVGAAGSVFQRYLQVFDDSGDAREPDVMPGPLPWPPRRPSAAAR